MGNSEHELDNLFSRYRSAFGEPEASAHFMPDLWRKIEARQSVLSGVRRLTSIFVATAAALCLLFIALIGTPNGRSDAHSTYVEVLAEAQPVESLAALGIVPREDLESNRK